MDSCQPNLLLISQFGIDDLVLFAEDHKRQFRPAALEMRYVIQRGFHRFNRIHFRIIGGTFASVFMRFLHIFYDDVNIVVNPVVKIVALVKFTDAVNNQEGESP